MYLNEGNAVVKKSRIIQFVLIVAICLTGTNAYGGKLDRVQKATANSASSRHDDDDNFDSTVDGDSLGLRLTLAIIFFPFWAPHALAEESGPGTGYFTGGPYQKSGCKNMQIQAGKNWYQTRPSDRPDKTSPVSLRLGAEYSYNFNAVHKPRAQLFLDTYTRFGFESSWTVFNRKPNSDETNPLTIGDGNLTFRFAQNRHVQFYAGIGSRILIDHGNATFGANFTYGIDIFPVKPIVISLVVDIGNVAEVFVTEAGATVGVILNNWEIYGGYNTLAIDNDRFQGPLLGVRKWF